MQQYLPAIRTPNAAMRKSRSSIEKKLDMEMRAI
jgi:hypothetical protein